MILKYIILCLFPFLLISCVDKSGSPKYQSKSLLLASSDSIDIKLRPNSRNLSNHIQFFEYQDTNYLSMLNTRNNSIEFYNLDAMQFSKELKIQIKGNNSFGGVTSFYVSNFDTIYLISSKPKKIGIINSSGGISKVIAYEKEKSNRTTSTDIPLGGQRPFLLENKIYLGQVNAARESGGKLTETGQRNSFINLTISIITGEISSSPLTYPMELIGKNVCIMHIERTIGFKDCFVYHFGFINNLFITDNHKKFISIPLEMNYDLKISYKAKSNLKKGLEEKLIHDEIINIYYDKYRECYYLIIRKREPNYIRNSSITTHFIYPDCFILVLDKNLHYLGEVYFPKDIYSFNMMFITHKGLYISEDNINNPLFSEDYMRFRLFTLENIRGN